MKLQGNLRESLFDYLLNCLLNEFPKNDGIVEKDNNVISELIANLKHNVASSKFMSRAKAILTGSKLY